MIIIIIKNILTNNTRAKNTSKFFLATMIATQLLSACATDPQVKKYETRMQEAKDLEIMNKEGRDYQIAKDTLDVKGKTSDQDPTNINKAANAKKAAEDAEKEYKEFENAKKRYQASKEDAEQAAKEAR